MASGPPLPRTILCLEMGVLLWAVAGCLVIPIPTNRVGDFSRKDIPTESINQLVIGQTTREQVLLRFGEPDEWNADYSRYRYHWERVKWDIFWIVAGGYSAAGGDIPINKNHDLVVLFDQKGFLLERTLQQKYQGSELEKAVRRPTH